MHGLRSLVHTTHMEEKGMLQKQAEELLLKERVRGKSKAAQAIDKLLGTALLALVFYVGIFRLTKTWVVSLMLCILLTAMVISVIRMVKRERNRRYLERTLLQLEHKVRMEKLFFAKQETFWNMLLPFLEQVDVKLSEERKTALWKGERLPFHVLYVLPDEKVDLRDVVQLHGKSGIVFMTGRCSEEIIAFLEKLGFRLVLDTTHPLLEASIPIEQEEVYRYVIDHAPKHTRTKVKKSLLFSPAHTKRYILCGVYLLVSSMFMLYPMYYRISACVLFALAAGCFVGRRKEVL